MVLRDPIAVVAKRLGEVGEINAVVQSLGASRTFRNRSLVQDTQARESGTHLHYYLRRLSPTCPLSPCAALSGCVLPIFSSASPASFGDHPNRFTRQSLT